MPTLRDLLGERLFDSRRRDLDITQTQWSQKSWEHLEHAYDMGAESIIAGEPSWHGAHVDFLGIVVAYLCRHSVECCIKGLMASIPDGGRVEWGHELIPLADEALLRIRKLELPVEEEVVPLIFTRLLEFQRLDAGATRFRYPDRRQPLQFDARRLLEQTRVLRSAISAWAWTFDYVRDHERFD